MILCSTPGRSLTELSREMECSVRTMQRDLQALIDCGFPIECERRGHESFWRIPQSFKKFSVALTLPELTALAAASNFYQLLPLKPLQDAYFSAMRKASAAIPAARRPSPFASRPFGAKDYSAHWSKVQQIGDAILERRTLRLTYFAYGSREMTIRDVDPYALWHFEETIYLIGFCRLRQDLRTFAIERIQFLEPTGASFEIDRKFSLESFVGKRFRVLQEDRTYTVRVRFSPRVAEYVRDRLWHPSQRFEPQPNGSVLLIMDVSGLKQVAHWILGYGADARVIEPARLREMLASTARKMARLYERQSRRLRKPAAKIEKLQKSHRTAT